MSTQLTITYRCCNATYTAPTGLLGPDGAAWVPKLDALHAADNPQCPPLDQPIQSPSGWVGA